ASNTDVPWPSRNSALSRSSRSTRRAHSTSCAPSSAKRRAHAAPILELAPVTSISFPSIRLMRFMTALGSRVAEMVKPVCQLDKVHAPPVPTVAHCNLSEQRDRGTRESPPGYDRASPPEPSAAAVLHFVTQEVLPCHDSPCLRHRSSPPSPGCSSPAPRRGAATPPLPPPGPHGSFSGRSSRASTRPATACGEGGSTGMARA